MHSKVIRGSDLDLCKKAAAVMCHDYDGRFAGHLVLFVARFSMFYCSCSMIIMTSLSLHDGLTLSNIIRVQAKCSGHLFHAIPQHACFFLAGIKHTHLNVTKTGFVLM